jgi:hypothetical protein
MRNPIPFVHGALVALLVATCAAPATAQLEAPVVDPAEPAPASPVDSDAPSDAPENVQVEPREPEEATEPAPEIDAHPAVEAAQWSDIQGQWDDRGTSSDDEDDDGWFFEKDGGPYPDVLVAKGFWHSTALLVSVGVMNLYFHEDPDDSFAFHGRIIGLGAISIDQRVVAGDGTISTERETAFVLEIIGYGVRYYFAAPFFIGLSATFGAAFYDGFVPTTEPQLGLGFQYRGWGLEAGIRGGLQPNDAAYVDGKKHIHTDFGLMAYGAFETNISL